MSKEFPITISSWTLGDQCKFEDRVKAAKEAGYEGIGLRAETYVDALNEGLFDEDILAILDKYDMIIPPENLNNFICFFLIILYLFSISII